MNGAHIDSPRLDLKPNPLYEKEDIAYFKTHYYGGIRKYQWGTIPLAIHGVVAKKNGELTESASVKKKMTLYSALQTCCHIWLQSRMSARCGKA